MAFRLMVRRNGSRVGLFTRGGGDDWRQAARTAPTAFGDCDFARRFLRDMNR